MGIPFVAQLGFAEIDSSGPIVPLSGTSDAAVQFYKLTQSVDGVITIPNNNKHKKIILDINGKTVSGGGLSPIVHNNDSTELSLKGDGFITSSGSLPISGSGVGNATVNSTTQGAGSTGTVQITVSDNTPKFPNVDSDATLVERAGSNYYFNTGGTAYHYYPDYYSGTPADDKPHHYTHTETSTPDFTGGSTWFIQQSRLIQDVNPGGSASSTSSIWAASNHLDPGYLIIIVTHNGVTVELSVPTSGNIGSQNETNPSSHPNTITQVYNVNAGFNFTSGTGSGTLTVVTNTSGGVSGQLPVPTGAITNNKYSWVVAPSGSTQFTIVAEFKTTSSNAVFTSTNGWSNFINGLFFGLGSINYPLPAGTKFRMPLKGTYTKGKKATVVNNNDNEINFTMGAAPNSTDSSVAANSTGIVANLLSDTSQAWAFSGEKPTATTINQSSAGINVIDSAFTVDVSQQVDFLPHDVSNIIEATGVYSPGSTGGQRSRYRLKLRSGSLPIRLPNGNTVTAGTVLSSTQMKSLLGSPSSPNNWGNTTNPFSWWFQSYPTTQFTTFVGSTFTMNTDNKTCLSMGTYNAGNSGGTNPSDFYYRGHCYHEDGFIQGFLLTINTTGGDVDQAVPPTEVSRSYVYGPHGDFSVALFGWNYFPSVKVGSVDVINGRTRFTNKGTTIINDFTPTILGSSRGNQGVLGINSQITLDSQDASSTFTGTVPEENTAGDPLAPATAFSGTGVSNNDSGRPLDGIDLSSFTGTINSIRSGEAPTTIYQVTVANSGSGNKFYIDGVEAPTLTFVEGNTYIFVQSDITNRHPLVHPLRFSTTSNGTHGGGTEYTTGVVVNGTTGYFGSYTKITVAIGAPTLYYYCTNHSGMGGQINT